MRDVMMITHFTQVPGENGNGRFVEIIDRLKAKRTDIEVEMVTTSFSHRTKSQRMVEQKVLDQLPYKLTMLNEPGYKKNVSLRRFYSHYKMGQSLKHYLNERRKPELIYCSVPSLDVAYIAMKYASQNKIPFIIDIQDIWPEAFKMVFNIPIVSDCIFYPMLRKANEIYKGADCIIAVSETYLNRALKVNQKVNHGESVFLGTDLAKFDKLAEENVVDKNKDEIWLTYIGTLGHSYSLSLVIKAIRRLIDEGEENIRLMVLGDGPLKTQFEEEAKRLNIPSSFLGRIQYDKMVGYLKASDIALNPIAHGAAQSIINKVGDYAAAGLPVISTQECEEYRKLVTDYHIGYNCIMDVDEIAGRIRELIHNPQLRVKMGDNNRQLANEKFDRSKTYDQIIEQIQELLN